MPCCYAMSLFLYESSYCNCSLKNTGVCKLAFKRMGADETAHAHEVDLTLFGFCLIWREYFALPCTEPKQKKE